MFDPNLIWKEAAPKPMTDSFPAFDKSTPNGQPNVGPPANLARTRPKIGPSRLDAARAHPEFDRSRPAVGCNTKPGFTSHRARPNFGSLWRTWGREQLGSGVIPQCLDFRASTVSLWPERQAKCGPISAKVGRIRATLGRTRTIFGRTQAEVGRNQAVGRTRADFGPIRSNLGRGGPISARVRPSLDQIWPTLSKLWPRSPHM